MAINEKIGLEITGKDNASKEIKKVNKTLEEIGKESEKATKSFQGTFTELNNKIQTVQFALGKFKQVFKTAFDWGEQGATVIQTTESFAMLLEKVGAAPDLLEQLQVASKGTISDMGLMSSTATLLAGTTGELATSLANATPELLEIAKAANKLNPSLGDTTFLYNSIATGIKRASPLILDNLGIVVKVGKANEDYAKALGKTVQQLTAEEQQMALLNATLEAGGNLIDQVGGNTDSATDSFARMEVSIENASNALKAQFAPMMINAADAVMTLLTRQEKIMEATNDHTESIIYSSESYKEYHDEIMRVAKLIGGRGVPAIDNLTESEWELARATAAAAGEDWALQEAANAVTTALIESEEATVVLKDATNDAEAAMRKYSEALLFKIASEGLSSEAALQLAYSMGLVDEKTVYATEKINTYREMLEAGIITEETFISLTTTLGSEMDKLPSDVNIDFWLKVHGYDDFQRVANAIGSGSMSGGGVSPGKPIAQAAGGDVRPGGTYIVGEHGIELLQLGQNGQGTITPMSNITNNYNLGVTTTQSLNTVTTGFAILQAMG